MLDAPRAARDIVRASTRLRSVALVPEIRLYQASEPISVWQRTETATGRTGLDPPFWAFAWAGGQALARYLLDHPETVRGRPVIDIASGSGLVAIAAARAGAAAVTAYDIDPLAVAAIALNAAANDVTVLAVGADILADEVAGTEVLLVADAFYERALAGRVTRFIERGQARGADVLVGDFGRAYLPRDRLSPLATYDVPGLAAVENNDVKRTTIWAPWLPDSDVIDRMVDWVKLSGTGPPPSPPTARFRIMKAFPPRARRSPNGQWGRSPGLTVR